MKKYWIIPLVLSLILLIVFPFRWEKGPTQTINKLKIINLKDRFTGQSWIKLYGYNRDDFYSGEENPHFTETQITKESKKILAGPKAIERKKDLEAKLEEANEKKLVTADGHTKYVRLFEQCALEYEKINPKPPEDNIVRGIFYSEWEWEFDRNVYAHSKIPEEYKKDYDAWRSSVEQIS